MKKKKGFLLAAILLAASMVHLQCADRNAHSENNHAAEQGGAADSTGADMAKKDTSKVGKKDRQAKAEDEAIPVEVTTLNTGTISSYLLLSSNLETEEMADVYSRVQGLVAKIHVEEGDFVRRGQVLMELEAEEYKLAADRAWVTYQQQKRAFERAEAMFKKQLLSREEFEQAKFTADGAELDWKQAKLNLNYTKITAPISGVIGERLRRPGDRIQPSDKLFTVINTDEMIAVVHIPEKEIGRVVKGQKAYLTSENLPGRRFSGWIKRVSPVVDPQSGTFKVTIGVRNADDLLRPGMFVNAHIITETHENAVLVPKLAILYENEYMYAFVVRDSLAHKIRIEPGFEDHENVEALRDFAAGDRIIVVGYAGLKDKTRVKVVAER